MEDKCVIVTRIRKTTGIVCCDMALPCVLHEAMEFVRRMASRDPKQNREIKNDAAMFMRRYTEDFDDGKTTGAKTQKGK